MDKTEPETLERPRASGTGPRTSVRYVVLAAMCGLAFIAYVQRVGFASAGIGLKDDIGLDERQWSRVMAAFLIAYAGFEIPSGILGDWFGARNLLAIAALGWSLVTAALA